MSDDDIINGILQNHRAAYEAYLEQYGENLVRWLLVRTKNFADAEDLHQEILWKVLNTWKLERGSSLRTWLYLLARQAVADWVRARRADEALLINLVERRVDTANQFVGADRRSSSAITARLHDAVHSLPQSLRQLFDLAVREEMTDEQVARLLDVKVDSVRTMRWRLIRELRQRLEVVWVRQGGRA